MKTIIIIDGNNLLHKGYFSIKNLSNSKGFPTGAIYGALNIIMPKIKKIFNPTNLIFVFDDKKLYKQEGLLTQIEKTQELLRHTEHDCINVKKFRINDIIASIAKKHEKISDVDKILILSFNDNFFGLINNKIQIIKKNGEYSLYGPQDFFLEFEGLLQEQFYDYKSIVGYKGFKNVGHSKAIKIIKEFGGIEMFVKSGKILDYMGKYYKELYKGKEKLGEKKLGNVLLSNKKLASLILNNEAVGAYGFFKKDRNENIINLILENLEFKSLSI